MGEAGPTPPGAPGDAGRSVVLPRVVPARPGRPARPGATDTQRDALRIARDPCGWDLGRASSTAARFDELSWVWDTERGGYRPAPLADALARGGPWPEGRCIEVGSGTGVLSPLVIAQWPDTVCVDLSMGMLVRAPLGVRVRADAARLPVRRGCACAVVVGDAPLFAPEIVRVLDDHGVVVWVNALGATAPYFVPSDEILVAMERADTHRWCSVESEALWGRWVVLRRCL